MNLNQEFIPCELPGLAQVSRFWRQCVDRLDEPGADGRKIAALMVNVVNNPNDDVWSDNEYYSRIFELAASLEVPYDNPAAREKEWMEIRQLLASMESSLRSLD